MSNSLRNTRKPRVKSGAASSGSSVIGKINSVYLMVFMLSTIVVLAILLVVNMMNNKAPSTETIKNNLSHLGEVVSHEAIPNSSMSAWVVKLKDGGEPVLFYLTKDGETMSQGTLWNAKTGDPLTTKIEEKFIELNAGSQAQSQAQANEQGQDLTPGQAIGKWDNEVPNIFNVLDKLGGFKEDESVSAADTVYVLYDPRCPYCHELFNVTRNIDMKAKGVTIKWLPTVLLGVEGKNDPVIGQAAYGLRVKNAEDFGHTFDGSKPSVDNVTEDDITALDANLSLLYEATSKTFGKNHPVSVPTALFLDKRTGQPRMVNGPQQKDILISIFGE